VFTYKIINGQPVIMKFLYNYLGTNNLPINVFNKAGKWFLARGATLHLHYAEAANRAGKSKLAYALVNRGLSYHYDSIVGLGGNRDVTRFMQTFLPPPYDFDARVGETPRYRNNWYRNQGIRGRAGLKLVTLPTTDSINNVEKMIIEEDALELAYEGQRWSDLLRVAIRRNDPSFLADKIFDKLRKSGLSASAAASARARLLGRDWFLPFKWQ
jgi:starch-binding outer membrane protein, SusD/RagB family